MVPQKTMLINIDDFFQKLDDYLQNPEEMPVLTVGTARAMAKECRMLVTYDVNWEEDAQYIMVFRGKENDKAGIQ